MMATLVRYHRKAIKLDDLPRFTLFKKKQFLPLIQLLRLACCSIISDRQPPRRRR